MADLWIRSQDKLVLTKARNIWIEKSGQYYAVFDDNNRYYIGIYETKERAIKVLDEIQELMVQPIAFLKTEFIKDTPIEISRDIIKNLERIGIKYVGDKDCEIIPTNATNIVYQMPKEWQNKLGG